MAQDMQSAGNVSAELDAMVCDLIGAFLDALAAGENPGVVVAIEDAASNRYLAALDEDGEEACLEAATNFISEHKMGLKDEGLGRISRYAIGYTGCVEIDGGYHDALLVSFFETTLESGFRRMCCMRAWAPAMVLCGATLNLQVRKPLSSKIAKINEFSVKGSIFPLSVVLLGGSHTRAVCIWIEDRGTTCA